VKCLPYDSAMQEVVRPCFYAPFLKEETEVGKKEGREESAWEQSVERRRERRRDERGWMARAISHCFVV